MSNYDKLYEDIETALICAQNGMICKDEFINYLKMKIIDFESKEKE
jgi:hypothetical protein